MQILLEPTFGFSGVRCGGVWSVSYRGIISGKSETCSPLWDSGSEKATRIDASGFTVHRHRRAARHVRGVAAEEHDDAGDFSGFDPFVVV